MFGKRLVALRKQKGISQYYLAEQLGLSRGQLSNYELGAREPDFATLKKLTEYFGVTADYLLGFSATQHSPENKLPVLKPVLKDMPLLTDENINEYISLPEYIQGDFALVVEDDCMIGTGILSGDLAICRKTDVITPSQVAVILDDIGDGLLKPKLTYCPHKDEAPKHKPGESNNPELNREGTSRISGVVVSLVRKDVTASQVRESNFIYTTENEWTEIMDLTSQAGLKAGQVKEILAGQIEIFKRLGNI